MLVPSTHHSTPDLETAASPNSPFQEHLVKNGLLALVSLESSCNSTEHKRSQGLADRLSLTPSRST